MDHFFFAKTVVSVSALTRRSRQIKRTGHKLEITAFTFILLDTLPMWCINQDLCFKKVPKIAHHPRESLTLDIWGGRRDPVPFTSQAWKRKV